MANKLTVKEAKLVKGKVKGLTHHEAYVEAGYSTGVNNPDKVARVNASRVLARPNVQEALQKEMERQGITTELIIKPIKDGLLAEKVTIVGNGDSAMAEITPDHSIRLKASSMAQTLIGANKTKEGGDTYNFNAIINKDRDEFGL